MYCSFLSEASKFRQLWFLNLNPNVDYSLDYSLLLKHKDITVMTNETE